MKKIAEMADAQEEVVFDQAVSSRTSSRRENPPPKRISADAGPKSAISDEKITLIKAHVRRYAGADDRKAWAVLAATALAQVAAVAMYVVGWHGLAMLLAAGTLVRTFMIYHDAVHYCFFKNRAWNDRLGTVLQLWTLAPVKIWRANHVAHHARFGDLGFHDVADTIFLTREKFDAMPRWKRGCMRVVRAPLVFFALVPALVWLVEYPFLLGNVWIWSGLALQFAFAWKVSLWHLGALYLSMFSGVLLFHLQHGMGQGYRAPTAAWRFEHGALLGSTWVPVPAPLSWFTLGIEFHHIHHLHPGVPCYALARCHREAPPHAWSEVTVGTWRNCLAALRNVMWDDAQGRLTPFPSLSASRAPRGH
jgi:omega-6 fatty acid desaturase (delta-12 desaturase)